MIREAKAFWLPQIRLGFFVLVTLHGVLARAAPPLLLFAVDLECSFSDLKVEDAADDGITVSAGSRFLIRKTG